MGFMIFSIDVFTIFFSFIPACNCKRNGGGVSELITYTNELVALTLSSLFAYRVMRHSMLRIMED